MLLVVKVNTVHVYALAYDVYADVDSGGMHHTLAELTYVFPDGAVFAKMVVTAVAGYSD